MFIIAELLSYKLIKEIENLDKYRSKMQDSQVRFNDMQLSALKLLAKGFTEKAAAIDIGISINTIRYHKRSIFEKLDTGNIIDAIIKAIKFGVISIDEI